jgi:hypothetical protein
MGPSSIQGPQRYAVEIHTHLDHIAASANRSQPSDE